MNFNKIALVSSLVVSGIAINISSAHAAGFSFSENFNNFGVTPNNYCPTVNNGKGICGAVEAINSFTFLTKTYPNIYVNGTSNLIIPNYNALTNTDPTDGLNFATQGWTVGGNTYQGYYPRPGVAIADYTATLNDWFNSYAPNTTSITTFNSPTIQQLATAIQQGQDTEFFILSNTIYHVLDLTAIACTGGMGTNGNDYTGCTINYQDPDNATTEVKNVPIAINNGSISFNYNGAQVNVQAAFDESPVPEPSNILGVVTALGFIAFFKRKFKNSYADKELGKIGYQLKPGQHVR